LTIYRSINALAETVFGLYKTELIRCRGPWRSLEQVELATAEWLDWWNHRRLHSAARHRPPAEYEELYHRSRQTVEVA
jgi:transposase InsO family protein